MKTIHKYQFRDDNLTLHLPVGAKFLHLALQHNIPCLWFLVDTEKELELRAFVKIGTGWEAKVEAENYLGTVLETPYVWHVFEITKD